MACKILLKFEKRHGICLSGYSSAVYGPTGTKQFYHTMIYHQFLWMRVREEPHWQGASMQNILITVIITPYSSCFSGINLHVRKCHIWSIAKYKSKKNK